MIANRMISATALMTAITPRFMDSSVSQSLSDAPGIAERKGINVVEVSYCLKKKRLALQVLFPSKCKSKNALHCFQEGSGWIKLGEKVFLI